ncbi:MAG TPA: allophanate hydrolase [Polyangia bacterium]
MLRAFMARQAASTESTCLDLRAVESGYGTGSFSPAELMLQMVERASTEEASGIWIHRVATDDLVRSIKAIEERRAAGAALPLFGFPFAVKDNIDVAGMPTTAGCPAFAYTPKRSAAAVQRLLDAGAIVLGKTNLDQFATGLVGTRSPYGTPRNPFDHRYIPGGSSSGSAVAVGAGMASFALGTDTAGSGRVPAAFNNIVGLKPSRGLISTRGVVPACGSLDCVSVFALSCADAWRVFEVARHFDVMDPYARDWGSIAPAGESHAGTSFRFGVPEANHLEFFGDESSRAAFTLAVETLQTMGGNPVSIDFAPFREAARLLYDGPWLAERLVAAGQILRECPDQLDVNVRTILHGAEHFGAVDVFRAQETLRLLRHRTQAVWRDVDVIVTPTAPTIYTLAQVQAEPLRLNTNLGYYTNFVNLLDLCALAVPAGFRADQLPFGITLMAPRGYDARLAVLGTRYHALSSRTVGIFQRPRPGSDGPPLLEAEPRGICLAVVGAHLSGEPLNHQLIDVGATFVKSTRTAPHYRLFELPNTTPSKPGLVRCEINEGVAIELEIWRLSPEAFGAFISRIPAPLCVGSIELENSDRVHGFLCEHHAVVRARDISSFGGWRSFRGSLVGGA